MFDDRDFELAVQIALDTNFYTAGEVYSNATRVFVQHSIADVFIAAMVDKAERMVVGDPIAADVNMGALISTSHFDKVLDYVKIGRAEGAQIVTGGKQIHPQGFENGYFVEPTILTNCNDSMRVTRRNFWPGHVSADF
jgi:betaine-aldehyde dehydrogenase